jgi:hypothetical protein
LLDGGEDTRDFGQALKDTRLQVQSQT